MPQAKASREPYRKLKLKMWNEPLFKALSPLPPSGQSLYIYLLVGPFSSIIPGLFKGGRAAIAEELCWEQEDFEKALTEALTLGLVKADLKARLLWLPHAIEINKPESPNVIKSWAKYFVTLPDCELKIEAWEMLKAACYGISEAFGKAFDESLVKPSIMPSFKPSRNQESSRTGEQELINNPPTPQSVDNFADPDESGFPLDVAFPDFLGLTRDDWTTWVNYRKDKRRPITTQAEVDESMLKFSELSEHGYSPESVIRFCIRAGLKALTAPSGVDPTSSENHQDLVFSGKAFERLIIQSGEPRNRAEVLARDKFIELSGHELDSESQSKFWCELLLQSYRTTGTLRVNN